MKLEKKSLADELEIKDLNPRSGTGLQRIEATKPYSPGAKGYLQKARDKANELRGQYSRFSQAASKQMSETRKGLSGFNPGRFSGLMSGPDIRAPERKPLKISDKDDFRVF